MQFILILGTFARIGDSVIECRISLLCEVQGLREQRRDHVIT